MSDFTVVDPRGWEYDLHSVYSAYIGYFQIHSISWYEKTWGHLFSDFEEFLAFSWPVITVTDVWTGRAHIVTRLNSIGAFIKMIKTRFGETLPQAPNILQVTPFETTTRHLRNISDYASYKKLHSTLPAVVLSALKLRVRAGEPKAIKELWEKRDKTFLAIDFEWSERNEKSCLEWGYAAVRCGHLSALNQWPPSPDTNYRKGHYIVEEYVDKVINKHCPNYPWKYAFGESQVIPKSKLAQAIHAIISSFASPESETVANTLVLVAHGIHGDLARMEEMKIKIPHNILVIDTAVYEKSLYAAGYRGLMLDKAEKPRQHGTNLSLENLLISFMKTPMTGSSTPPKAPQREPFVLPQCTMHNAGNDAFMCLFALQMLIDPHNTPIPSIKPGRIGKPGPPVPTILTIGGTLSTTPLNKISNPLDVSHRNTMLYLRRGNGSYRNVTTGNKHIMHQPSSAYDLAGEFGQMQLEISQSGDFSLTAPKLRAKSRSPGRVGKAERLSVYPMATVDGS